MTKEYTENKCKEFKSFKETGILVIETVLGKLVIEQNDKEFPNGVTIKLNNAPIVLVEESMDYDSKAKIVVKRYPNNNVENDDFYFNTDPYQVESIDEDTAKEILKDIEY